MGLAELFGFGVSTVQSDELPDIFPLSISQLEFIKCDVITIYSKILADVVERTQGLTEEQQSMLWDNCLMSESNHGLITLLATAMADKEELFLVLDNKVLRKATVKETEEIRADYKKSAASKVGVFISFKNYGRSDMVKLYSALEYCTVGSLNKTMNLSKAIQIKLNDLRASVGHTDKAEAKAQALAIANGLGKGRDVSMDGKDTVETSKPDLTSINQSMELLNQKRAFYLGVSSSYITGESEGGLSDTGEGDTKANERGFKNYFVSVLKPVLSALFNATVTYKSQDFRMVAQGLQALQTFELVDDTLLNSTEKKLIIDRLFDIEGEKQNVPTV